MFDLKYFALAAFVAAAPAMADVDPYVVEHEAPAMRDAAGAAERLDATLVLHLPSGKTKTFVDKPPCQEGGGPDCFGYLFKRYDKARGLFVVEEYYYEGGDHIIVDALSGSETRLQGEPNFSPNGDIAVELVWGEERYRPGNPAMRVWRRKGGQFVSEWSEPVRESDETYFSILGWSSNDRIDVLAITQPTSRDKGGTRRFSIEHTASGWHVVDP